MNKYLAYGLAFWAMQTLAQAQSDSSDIPPPSPPFVQFPSPNMAFTITVTAPDGQAVKPPPPPPSNPSAPKSSSHEREVIKIDAVEIGLLRCDTISYDDNSQTQTWFVGKYGLVQSPNGDWINLVDPIKYPIQKAAMLRRDASDYFSWLGSSNYVKVVSYRGTQCYQFKMGEERAPTIDEDNVNTILGANEKIAWIDVKTHYPVAIQLQKRLYTYTFHDPPTQALVLPPKFKAKADRYRLL
jgi:hypothetical protein